MSEASRQEEVHPVVPDAVRRAQSRTQEPLIHLNGLLLDVLVATGRGQLDAPPLDVRQGVDGLAVPSLDELHAGGLELSKASNDGSETAPHVLIAKSLVVVIVQMVGRRELESHDTTWAEFVSEVAVVRHWEEVGQVWIYMVGDLANGAKQVVH